MSFIWFFLFFQFKIWIYYYVEFSGLKKWLRFWFQFCLAMFIIFAGCIIYFSAKSPCVKPVRQNGWNHENHRISEKSFMETYFEGQISKTLKYTRENKASTIIDLVFQSTKIFHMVLDSFQKTHWNRSISTFEESHKNYQEWLHWGTQFFAQ